jgi:hypothetical protein
MLAFYSMLKPEALLPFSVTTSADRLPKVRPHDPEISLYLSYLQGNEAYAITCLGDTGH